MSECKEQQQAGNKQARQFLKGTLVLTLGGLVVKVIGSLNWIFLSRVLGGEGIGLYQMAFPIYLLALSISSAGIPVAISIMTAEKLAGKDYRGAERVFHVSLAVLTLSGLALSALMYGGAGWLTEGRWIRDARAYYSLLALAPAVFFVTILASFRGYLQGWQIMTPTAVSQIAEQIFRVIAMLLFASWLLPYGLDYAAGGASLGAGAGAVAGLLVLIYYYWKIKRQHRAVMEAQPPAAETEPVSRLVSRIIRLALPVSLASIMLPAVSNLDLFIVPARLEVAGYSVEQATELFGYLTGMAVPLVNLATIFTASMATSLVPAIAEADSLGDKERIRHRTASALRISHFVTIPGAVGLWVLAGPVADMVYHAPQAAAAVQILALSVYLLGLHQVTTGVLQGLGHTGIPVINMGVAALGKVALNWSLTAIPALGIQGAAWATVADMGVAAALNLYFIRRYIGVQLDVKHALHNAVAALIMGVGVYYIYAWVLGAAGSNALATVIALFAGVVLYVFALVASGGASPEDVRAIPMVGGVLSKILPGMRRS